MLIIMHNERRNINCWIHIFAFLLLCSSIIGSVLLQRDIVSKRIRGLIPTGPSHARKNMRS